MAGKPRFEVAAASISRSLKARQLCVQITVVLLLTTVFTGLATRTSVAAGGPSATNLGTLGGVQTSALYINENGDVAGDGNTGQGNTGHGNFPTGDSHAFVWTRSGGLVDLGPLGGEMSAVSGINNPGQVIGQSDTDSAGGFDSFLWTPGIGMQALAAPAGYHSYALELNDGGQIAGQVSDATGEHGYACVWMDATGPVDIGSLFGGSNNTSVAAENNSGAVIGSSYDPNSDREHPYLWTPTGGMQDLGTLGGAHAEATGINDSGMVVGWSDTSAGPIHPFAWTATGGMVDLGSLGGYVSNTVLINNNGQVFGSGEGSTGDGDLHVWSWTAAGGMVDAGSLGSSSATLAAVNDSGQLVGTSRDADYLYAFSWTASGGLINANSLGGNAGSEAHDINNAGQIAGDAFDHFQPGHGIWYQAILWENIAGQSPSFTSAASATVGLRTPFDFKVTTTGFPPAEIDQTTGTFPAGVTFSPSRDGTGDFTGAAEPGSEGTYPFTLVASNGLGDPVTQNFVLTVTATPSSPSITSAATDTETFGVPFSFTVNTSGYPAPKLTKSGNLPAGVTFVNDGDGTATLSGTPSNAAIGTYAITLTAKSGRGTATQPFTLVISKAPTVKKIPTTTGQVGSALNIGISTKGYTVPAVSQSGLPGGLTLNDNGDGTAAITGTPQVGTGGSYPVTIVAQNAIGTAAQTFTLKINEGPMITSPAAVGMTVGTSSSFTVTATGFPAPKFLRTGTLPTGVSFNASTGVLSGTPKAKSAGTYAITIEAANSSGTSNQQLTITVH